MRSWKFMRALPPDRDARQRYRTLAHRFTLEYFCYAQPLSLVMDYARRTITPSKTSRVTARDAALRGEPWASIPGPVSVRVCDAVEPCSAAALGLRQRPATFSRAHIGLLAGSWRMRGSSRRNNFFLEVRFL